MKKKIMLILTMTLLIMTVGGCGNKNTVSEETVETETVESSTDEVEETTEYSEEVTSTEESTEEVEVTESTEEKEEVNENDLDGDGYDDVTGWITPEAQEISIQGLDKIEKAMNAYTELLDQKKMVENAFVYFYETGDPTPFSDTGLITKDGCYTFTGKAFMATLQTYYYNYVNNNTGYYDFYEWFCDQESCEALESLWVGEEGRQEDGSLCLSTWMSGACYVLPYLNEVTYDNIYIDYYDNQTYKNDSWYVGSDRIAYALSIAINDELDAFAYFDEEGDLLDIRPTESWWETNKMVYTFKEKYWK